MSTLISIKFDYIFLEFGKMQWQNPGWLHCKHPPAHAVVTATCSASTCEGCHSLLDIWRQREWMASSVLLQVHLLAASVIVLGHNLPIHKWMSWLHHRQYLYLELPDWKNHNFVYQSDKSWKNYKIKKENCGCQYAKYTVSPIGTICGMYMVLISSETSETQSHYLKIYIVSRKPLTASASLDITKKAEE